MRRGGGSGAAAARLVLVAATAACWLLLGVDANPFSRPRPAAAAAAATLTASSGGAGGAVPPSAGSPVNSGVAGSGSGAAIPPPAPHQGLPRTPVVGFLNAAFQHRGRQQGQAAPTASSAPSVVGGGSGSDARPPAAAGAPAAAAAAAIRPPAVGASTTNAAAATSSSIEQQRRGWFNNHNHGSKPSAAAPVPATKPAVPAHAPAPLAASKDGSASTSEADKGQNQGQSTSNNNRFAHVDMKGFWESLRTWASFKRYVRGVRDLILIAKPVEHFLLRTGAVHDRDLSRFLGSAVSFLVYSVLLTSVLGTFGIDTKPLIAGIGISGFVVGFALKEIATNTLSGILLVVQRPFKTGWKIKVGSHNGVVLSIDSRYVRLQTDDGQQILLPSYQVYSAAIVVQEKTDKNGRPIPAAPRLDTTLAAAAAAAASTPPSSGTHAPSKPGPPAR